MAFQDKNEVDVEKMKSTLILCYGYVALNAPEDQILTRIDGEILKSISKHFNTKVWGSGKAPCPMQHWGQGEGEGHSERRGLSRGMPRLN